MRIVMVSVLRLGCCRSRRSAYKRAAPSRALCRSSPLIASSTGLTVPRRTR